MAAAAQTQPVSGISRREFLYYIWGASIALYLAEFTGLLVWFAIPRIKEGEFGGVFRVPIEQLPAVNAPPVDNPDGRFYLVNLDTTDRSLWNERMYEAPDEEPIKGVVAVYKVCTHLGCIFAWNDANHRFQCPCHGSKYRLDGRRIESPAPRTADRFVISAVLDDGSKETSGLYETGMVQPLDVDLSRVVEFEVDTGARKSSTSLTLLSELQAGP